MKAIAVLFKDVILVAFEPGGRADKLGNRHEGRWVVKQLLRLINEDIKSVTIESIGDDERGVDLVLVLNDGRKQFQQCKARNTSEDSWSISHLKARGVLENIQFQLDRDPTVEFIFVSGVPSTTLRDICHSARNSNGNAEDFFQHQLKGNPRQDAIRQFCSALGLDPAEKSVRGKAYDYLRRIYIQTYPDDENTWNDLIALSGFMLDGAPETVISTLRTYAENNDKMGSPIFADILLDYLVSQNIHPKYLARDSRIYPVIERLHEEFSDSIAPGLINAQCIPREETTKCMEAIESKGIVILHGPAGYGKSSILYELVSKFKEKGILFLPIRLDRRIPENTATQFGEDMGLPDSPALCLAKVVEKRFCVLLLDQLDAIRWTTAHSANSLDVCKELVRQVLSYRNMDRNINISVVLICRTFDLNHDPEIKNWLSNNKDLEQATKVEVLPLPDVTVRQFAGNSYEKMNEQQRRILSIPQNLSMWIELSKQEGQPLFVSSVDLMKQFWAIKKSQLENNGISTEDINSVIDTLSKWLEEKSKITAPNRVLMRCSENAVAAFKSCGIIQEQHNSVGFYHQSYLDFLIASRVIEQIDSGGSILQWLGEKKQQTLFRREQLRQALAMLAMESPHGFYEAVTQILSSDDVRFHLKYLVLELVGEIEQIDSRLFDYLYNLSLHDNGENQVMDTVFYGRPKFIQELIKRGIINEWICSGNDISVNRALSLLRSVSEKIPEQITEILSPLVSAGNEWPSKVLETLCWKLSDDSEDMFALRLRLMHLRLIPNFVDWKDICAQHPLRAIRLLNSFLETWDINEDKREKNSRLEYWYDIDLQELLQAAQRNPLETWDCLMPHVIRHTTFEATPYYDTRLYKWRKDDIDYSQLDIARGIVELLIKAGQTIAIETPELLLDRLPSVEDSLSVVVQEILLDAFLYLPQQYADVGVRWLLKDLAKVNLGYGTNEPQWMPAFRLVQALSPYCSSELFDELENALVTYHDPNEKQYAKSALKSWHREDFDYFWGEAQYFLLPALDAKRINKKTAELIQVLKRKFAGCFSSRSHTGGFIGSKLDKNLLRISDSAWLDIISNDKIPIESRGKWEQVGNDHIVETSIWQFSSSLACAAKWWPERFARLSLRFPAGTHTSYISAILDSLRLKQHDKDTPENIAMNWKPASVDAVLRVVEKYCDLKEREVAISFCRLITDRAEENWPDAVLEKLMHLAVEHLDLEEDKLNVGCDKAAREATVDTLFQNTINCVRGVAAHAIGQLLWQHSELYQKVCPAIESLVADPHPVIRMAAIEILLPALNIDRMQAVKWFCAATVNDSRIPSSPRATIFFNYTILQYAELLEPIISQMVDSGNTEISQHGAEIATAYYLFYSILKGPYSACLLGSTWQRKGVAKAAARFVSDRKYAEKCRDILIELMNDNEKEVRVEVSNLFRTDVLHINENISFVQSFVKSKSFPEETFGFFHCIEEHKESLIPFADVILDTCEAICNADDSKDKSTRLYFANTQISPLLLRLYEQSQDQSPDISDRCLDAWDELFEKRIGNTREMTKGIGL